MTRLILICTAIGLILGLGLLSGAYFRDMDRAYDRISENSSLISSPYGDIEYSESGEGPAVLVSHGSGGGFDQGELIAQHLLGDEFRMIVPSRFGYLRSSLPANSTFDDQADAYAYLLDQLGLNQVAVLAFSHGGPSALLLAALHPERVSSLTLVSCGVASSSAEEQAQANTQGAMLAAIFQRDLAYWAITRAFRKQFLNLLGATDSVISGLTTDQRKSIDEFIDGMNPVSLRGSGAMFDNRAAMPNERIAAISVPTLVVHAVDDTLQIFRNAQYAVATIPNAELLQFQSGGHLVLLIEQETVSAAVQAHIRDHLRPQSARTNP